MTCGPHDFEPPMSPPYHLCSHCGRTHPEEAKAGRCGTCKHWTTIAAQDNPGWGPHLSLAEGLDQKQINRTTGLCGAIELVDDSSVSKIEVMPLAFTQDASMFQADLWTQAEFGCVLHEPKEPT